MAKRTTSKACPLCGSRIESGDSLEALGRHFRVCPKTDRSGDVAESDGDGDRKTERLE